MVGMEEAVDVGLSGRLGGASALRVSVALGSAAVSSQAEIDSKTEGESEVDKKSAGRLKSIERSDDRLAGCEDRLAGVF